MLGLQSGPLIYMYLLINWENLSNILQLLFIYVFPHSAILTETLDGLSML